MGERRFIHMAAGFMNYSNSNRCPICGGPDWCGYKQTDNGSYMFVCMRSKEHEKGDVFTGFDGREYESKGMNTQGNYFFYLHADCEQWRQEHGYSKRTGSGVKPIPPRIQKQVQHEAMIEPLDNKKLNDIYDFLLNSLKLEDADRKYLYAEGFTDDIIERYNIKTLPEPDEFRAKNKDYRSTNYLRRDIARMTQKMFGSLTGVPGFYEERDKAGNGTGVWNISGLGGILFPLPDPYGNMYNLRVRVHRANVGKGKYRNFSSYQEETICVNSNLDIKRNRYLNGTSSGNNCGLYANTLDDYTVVFITEGEKKGIIANEYFHYPVGTLPGVNSYRKLLEPIRTDEANGKRFIDVLKERGTKLLIVAFDADKAINDAVLKNEQQTIDILRKEGFLIASAEWDIRNGKGLDDLLRNGFTPRYKLYA